MKHIQRFFLSIFLLVFTGTCLAVPAGVNWQWANPKPQGNPFNSVAYNRLANGGGAFNRYLLMLLPGIFSLNQLCNKCCR